MPMTNKEIGVVSFYKQLERLEFDEDLVNTYTAEAGLLNDQFGVSRIKKIRDQWEVAKQRSLNVLVPYLEKRGILTR